MDFPNQEAVDALEQRALGFALAARLAAYPDDGLPRELEALVESLGTRPPEPLEAFRQALTAEGGLDAVRGEYLALFGSQKERASLNETEYGRMRGMSKGHDLADIAGFYRAFGLEVTQDDARRDMPDHLAMELEFYAVLLARSAVLREKGDGEGVDIVLDARKKFLEHHLGRLARAVAANPTVGAHPLFAPAFGWAGGLVADECRALGVVPPPLDFFPNDAEPDDVSCGVLPQGAGAVDAPAAPPRPR